MQKISFLALKLREDFLDDWQTNRQMDIKNKFDKILSVYFKNLHIP